MLEALHSEEVDLRARLERTGQRLEGINADQAGVRADITAVGITLDSVQRRYRGLVGQLGHLDWTLGVLQGELDQGERDLEDRRRMLAERLAEAYRRGQTSLLEQVLMADSFSDVLADVSSYFHLGDQDAKLAREIARDQEDLDVLRQTTRSTRYRTDQLRLSARRRAAEIAQQRARLVAAERSLARLEGQAKRAQEQQLADFRRVRSSQGQARKKLEQQSKAQAAVRRDVARIVEEQRRQAAAAAAARARREAEAHLLAEQARQADQARQAASQRAARERARRTAPASVAGGGGGPFVWPVAGVVTQEFGCTGFELEPPLGHCRHFHKGIDIAAPLGTPIRAAAGGTVAFVGYNPYDQPGDQAWLVIVVHRDGLVSWYAHLQGRRPGGISQGARVSQGQLLGYAGNTGRSTGVHLHWQVERNGAPVNPRGYI